MAFSAVVSSSCTLQTQSRLSSAPKSHPLSPTMSFIPPQAAAQKFLYQPLKYRKVSEVEVNPKRCFGIVKALKQSHHNVEVLSKEHLAVTVAYDVSELSKKFTEDVGSFTVVLSGDSSIKYLRKLVEPPYVDSIDWSNWHVFLVAEQVVPKTHLESNYKLVYDRFLTKVRIPASNVHTMDDTLQADEAAKAYETTLRGLVESKVIASSSKGLPKFDLVLLGVGPDGHVASLFPGHPLLRETEKWVTFLRDSPTAPLERITLTLPVINSCSNIAMVVSGAGKANAVQSALEDHQEPETQKLPVEMVSPVEGQVKWYLEKGAASKLFNL